MAIVVIKTVKNRRYRYLQSSHRSGGRVRTRSTYLGPADGEKRKRVKISIGDILMNLLAFGGKAMKGELEPRKSKGRYRDSGRNRLVREKQMRALHARYGLDLSSSQAFEATRALLSPEQWTQLVRDHIALGRAHRSERAAAAPKQDWSSLEAKMRTSSNVLKSSQTPQNAPGQAKGAETAPSVTSPTDDAPAPSASSPDGPSGPGPDAAPQS